MGAFLYRPASARSGGSNDLLEEGGRAVVLTWSAPALEEFVAVMAGLERDFLDAWRKAGLPILPQARRGRSGRP
ncbi:hypothetical protein GCM10010274_26850 [Streptomyces lavendofoliae]|uniref:Uncharacterized protein n=1 Tax=Streptomyces lavendofoliae TaxID=67314 RepID=A0A918HWW0_9ACTN|nr:hypothetical protein GCM10010274_26850 [Streptomyces lavendofoliae]